MSFANALVQSNLVQSLGLNPAINEQVRRGEISAQNILREAELDSARKRALTTQKINQNIREKREKSGLFQVIGAAVGTVGGALLGGPTGASLGAKAGQQVGAAVSGVSPQVGSGLGGQAASAIGVGADLFAGFQGLKEQKAANKRKKFAEDTGLLKDLKGTKSYTDESIQRAIDNADLGDLEVKDEVLNQFDSDQQKVLRDSRKEIRKDSFYKSNKDAYDSADAISGLIKTGNPVAQEAGIVKLARATLGGGVLTDRDVDRFGGSSAVDDRFNRIKEKALKGTLTSADKKFVLDTAKLLKTRASNNVNRFVDDEIESLSIIQNIDKDRLNPILGNMRITAQAPEKIEAPAPVTPTFNSVEDAEAANLPVGTEIIINGRKAIVR